MVGASPLVMYSRLKVAVPLLSAILSSCAKQEPPVSPTTDEAEPTASSLAPAAESEGTIKISRTIQQACGLSDSEAHFKFDSAVLRAADSDSLGKIATCFIDGPLAGEQMSLVGRADPRGDEEYNVVLGGSRGDNVKIYLVSQGMNSSNIVATSRGEMDATGNDEAGWQQDRRVDVKLASEL